MTPFNIGLLRSSRGYSSSESGRWEKSFSWNSGGSCRSYPLNGSAPWRPSISCSESGPRFVSASRRRQ